MEDKGYHQHKAARALRSGSNSSAHPLLGSEDALLPLASPFVSNKKKMVRKPSISIPTQWSRYHHLPLHLFTKRDRRKKSLLRCCFVCKQRNQPLFLSCTETAFVQPGAATTLGYRVLHQGQPRPAVVTSSSRSVTSSSSSAPAEGPNLPSTAGCEQVPGNYSDHKNTGTGQAKGRGSILAVCS